MHTEGPPLQVLVRRIAETPPDFLDAPRIGSQGSVVLAAVVRDLLDQYAPHGPLTFDPALFTGHDPATDRGWSGITLVLCWLLAEPALRELAPERQKLLQLLTTTPRELAAFTNASLLVNDADRREELARLSLAGMGLRPAGESAAQAQDRLVTMSSVERARVIAASRAAEQRAREVREALARKAAEESADKWSRE